MNEHEASMVVKLIAFLRAYRNHIKEISIYPMGKSYGRDNYNLHVIIKNPYEKYWCQIISSKWCNSKEIDERIEERSTKCNYIINSFKGADGWEATNMTNYLQKAMTINSFIKCLVDEKYKVSIYDYEGEEIESLGVNFMIFKNQQIHKDYTSYARSLYLKELKKIPPDDRKFCKNLNINSIEDFIKNLLKNQNQFKEKHNQRLDRLCSRIIDIERSIYYAYEKSLMGKISSGTALTPKELEKSKGIVKAYKELIKLKSFIKSNNELIKI